MASGLNIQVPTPRGRIATVAQPRANAAGIANAVARGGTAIAQGLGGIGQTLSTAGERGMGEARRQQEKDAAEAERQHKHLQDLQRRATATKLSADLTQSLTSAFLDAQKTAGDGAPGFAESFGASARRRAEDMLAGIQDEETRLVVGADFNRIVGAFGTSAVKFQIGEQQTFRANALTQSAKAMGVAIYADPDQYQAFVDQGLRGIATAGLSQDQARAHTAAFLESAAEAYTRSRLDHDPTGLLADLGGPHTSGSHTSGPTPGTADDVWSRMLQVESGGRQTRDDGTPVTSPAGAVGIAQVMPATGPEAARLAGLTWDETRYRTDAHYNEALGRAYFNTQLETFGDPRLAAAAYNAGPGRVQAFIQDGRPLPAETQDYVDKIFGRGTPSAPGVDITRHPAYRFLTPAQISAFRSQAETRTKEDLTARRASVKRKIDNEIASHGEGLPVSGDDQVSDASIYAAYPDAPDTADAYIQKLRAARAVGPLIADMAISTPADIAAMRATVAIRAGDDVVAQRQALLDFDQAVAANAGSRKDPAAHVQKYFPKVAAAFEAAQQAGGAARLEALGKAIDLSMEAQTALAFPEADQRALPDAVAKSLWQGATTAEDKVAMVSLLADHMPARAFRGMTEHLAGKQAIPEIRQVAMLRDRPEIAASVLRGTAALATGARLAPPTSSADWKDAEKDALGSAGLFLLDPSPGQQQSLHADTLGAIRGRYADLMALAGDTSGTFNKNVYKQAVTDVTGGVLKWPNTSDGRQFFAPLRGMTQDQLTEVMDGLADADLTGAQDMAGRPIKAETLRRRGTLVDVGPGRYGILMSGEAVMGTDGRAYVLDLRDKARTVMGAGMTPNTDRGAPDTTSWWRGTTIVQPAYRPR